MAVNFGNTIMEGEITPSVAVQNPVQDDSGAVLANGFASAAKFAGQVAGNLFVQNDQDAKYKVLNNYENDFLGIVDAYEQGIYTQQEAMLRARSLRSQYLGNAPALRDDFDKVWTQVTKDSGLGHTLIEGTVADRAAEQMELEGAKLGYTPEQWQQFQANARMLSAYQQQLELTTTQNGIVTEGMKQRGLELVTNVAASAVPAAQKLVNDTIAQLDAAPDATSKGEIVTAFNLQIGQSLASIEGGSMGVDTTYITKPMKDLQAMVADYANGTVDITMLENSIKFTNLTYNQMMQQDPQVAAYLATAAVLKDVGLNGSETILQQLYDPDVLKRITAINTQTAVNMLDNSPASAKTFQSMSGVAATPGLSEEGVSEVMDFTTAAIDGIYTNERSAKDGALGYKDTITYLASPGVREMIAQNGMTAQFAQEASDIIAKNYETVLGPAINQYWTSVPISDPTTSDRYAAMDGGISNIPMNQLLEPVWNGSAVEFVPKPEYASNPRVVALAGEVNTGPSSIGVPLNENINAQSVLTKTDPKTLWEQTYAQKWFGIGGEDDGPLAERVEGALTSTDPATREGGLSLAEFQPEEFEYAFAQPNETTAPVFNVAQGDGGLLDFIGSKEAPKGYDQQYDGASLKPPKPLTQMTVGEVRQHQRAMVANGSASSAVGKYQVIQKTMDLLLETGVVSPNDLFNEETQDRIAIGLLRLRGLDKWLNGQMSDETFANAIAHEWASMPLVSGPNKGASAYAGDGLNKSLTSVEEFMAALRSMKGNA